MRITISLAVLISAQMADAACEQMLGLEDPPVADLLAARPTVEAVRYAPSRVDGCEVGADLVIGLAPSAELDWLDIVLTRKRPDGGTELVGEVCAMIGETLASTRTELLIPGQRYVATVAAYDVEGRKSEPVNLELTGPGISSREWMAKAPYCPEPHSSAGEHDLPRADLARQPWSRAVVGGVAGAGFLWVMWLLVRPRKRREP